jgi:anti-sigma regulatory factor (Ser/Thr protein kinase)
VYDILLAATEACTNVLTHGGRRVRDYAVVTSLGAVGCQVEVADDGADLSQGEPGKSPARRTGDSRPGSTAWPTTSPWTSR